MLRTRILAGTTAGLVLSAVFACVLAVVNVSETFVDGLRVRPGHPAPLTLRVPHAARELAPGSRVAHSDLYVARGETVRDPERSAIIRTYESSRRPARIGVVLGHFALYFLIALMMMSYLRTFSPGRGALLRTQAGLLGLSAFLLIAAKVFLLLAPLPATLIPVASVTLWCSLFLERRTALMMSVALAFLTASLAGFSVMTVAVYVVSSVTAAVVFQDRKHASHMIVVGLVSGILGGVAALAASLLVDGSIDLYREAVAPWRSPVLMATASGLLAGIVAFIFQHIAVVALGAVSRQRLLELTDVDHPLLKKMAREAPGSWEHSRAMANLAEAAAAAIGADALLTRVGAYYHDLGKTCQAKYFVENLLPGEETPHKHLDPDVSADAIMAHVVEGTRILREGRIPEPVVEFCYTHHGTSVIEYFWHKCIEQGNPKHRNESFFRYPGMRPRTKETAILMLIDGIEAAARTIDPPTREKFEEMVQRIVFVKLRQGQLDESGLVMSDIRTLTTKIVDVLCSAYHNRIKYPWQDKKGGGAATLPLPGVATERDVARQRTDSEHGVEEAARKKREVSLHDHDEDEEAKDESP